MHIKILLRHLKGMPFKEKLFTIFVFIPMLFFFGIIVKKLIANLQERRRYKKMIKKGIFWDTEYLIERDEYGK